MDEQFALAEASEYPSNGGPPEFFTYNEGWLQLRDDLDYDEWTTVWRSVEFIEQNRQWYIADCLLYGEAKWGEDYAAVVGDYAPETMRTVMWVGRVFPKEDRRIGQGLRFTHFRLVAKLDKPDRDRLLDEAVAEKLSTRDLEQRVKAMKTPAAPKPLEKDGDDPGDQDNPPVSEARWPAPKGSDQLDPRAIRAPFERLREDFMARSGPDGSRMHDQDDALVWEAVLAAVDYVLVGRASAETGLRFALEQLRLQAVE